MAIANTLNIARSDLDAALDAGNWSLAASIARYLALLADKAADEARF